MTSSKKAKIDKLILSTYVNCDITCFPFDCKKILRKYGYRCKAYSALSPHKLKLFKGISDDACIIDETIYYNDTVLEDRVSFTLMHELGHILLGHHEKSDTEENEADYFASCILAPRIMIHHLCTQNEYLKVTAGDIHDYFGISVSASNRAVMDYHEWYANIAHTTRKPSDTELAIKDLFVEKFHPIPKSRKQVKANTMTYRYLMDIANDEYFIREMERRRTEPY